MAEIIQRAKYFYTEVRDKPGEVVKVFGALKDAGVALSAFVPFCKGRKAQLHLVSIDAVALKAAARKAKMRLVGRKTAFLRARVI